MTAQRGFTLIELAIVLVIMTILIGGLAVPLSAQIQARRIAETKKTLEEAREAIIGYAMSHPVNNPYICTCNYDTTLPDANTPPQYPLITTGTNTSKCTPTTFSLSNFCPPKSINPTQIQPASTRHYLPCPDLNGADPEPNLDNDGVDGLRDINNGAEDRQPGSNSSPFDPGPSCAASSGNLPWVTLGTAAQDAWGNRLRYATHADLTNSTSGFHNGSAPVPGNPWNQVCSAENCPVVDVAADVPVVLVSHGANGWGARNVNGNTLASPSGANEQENLDGDNRYISRTPSKPSDASGEFDDLTTWLSFNVIINRVCPAGGCP